MGDGSHIEWTDATWNPTVGCSHVSAGCDLCYAARETAGRLSGLPVYAGLATREEGQPARFTGEVRALRDRLTIPLRWQRPRFVFVNSMSDLFHPEVLKAEGTLPGVPFLAEVFAVMAAAPRHTFQVLTKRPQLAAAVLAEPRFRLDVNACLLRRGVSVMRGGFESPWPDNIWLGTSIETRPFLFRARHVKGSKAAVRFLSLEPLLGPLGTLDLSGIDWVIAGGESGHGARPMHPDWARAVRDQCVDQGVPFLFKQWGEWAPEQVSRRQPPLGPSRRYLPPGYEGVATNHGVFVARVGKKAAGRELDGRTWDERPERVPA